MRVKYYLSLFVGAAALLFASCNNDSTGNGETYDGEPGSLKIVLKGEAGKAATANTDENSVNNFRVYVFNANTMTLEEFANGVIGGNTIISGLSTGFQKKVVVVANVPSTFPEFNEGDEYEQFAEAASAFNLDYQTPANIATNGLVMYGETEQNISLSATSMTTVTIPIKRLVAKVVLGTVTVNPSEDYDPDLFTITGVSIQRAVSKADIFGNTYSTIPEMYAGFKGSYNSTLKSYLKDDLDKTYTVGIPTTYNNYFYVFPNADRDNCTLLTLVGDYDGVVQYFPIEINYHIDQMTDGTLITSNMVYTINIKLNNLAEGTDDPDVPPTKADLTVNIEPQEWDLNIIQNVVW